MASSSSLLCFFYITIPLIYFLPSTSATKSTITLSLNHFTQNPFPDPWQTLTHFASASLSRAKHIKNPKTKQLSTTPLFPQSYGAYSVSLSFGTPPQTIPFVMDTGSDLVWFPCTQRYLCKNCSSSNPNTKIPTFLPKMSSSSKLIGCRNPKCSWIHDSDVQSRCTDCQTNSTICSQICPPYIVMYGSASTGGILLSETLDFTEKVPNFAVGCSLFASKAPAGIAGFGRGSASLPSQLGLKKFSYCLISHRFDDSTQSSSLVLTGGSDTGDTKTTGVRYTPFVKNPVTGKPAFSVYYYVGLKKITVGDKAVKIPYSYLSQGSDGNGGTIVDSGSTLTFMESRVFELVASEVEKQTTHYKRATEVEALTGFRPCYDFSTAKSILLPKLTLHFKGGADMELPLSNYFSLFGPNGVACMTIVTDGVVGANLSGGPAVILGNYQLQNFYVEYDLDNQRFGFQQQTCK